MGKSCPGHSKQVALEATGRPLAEPQYQVPAHMQPLCWLTRPPGKQPGVHAFPPPQRWGVSSQLSHGLAEGFPRAAPARELVAVLPAHPTAGQV